MTLTTEAIAEIKTQLLLRPKITLALTGWAEARSRLEPHRGWVPNPIDAMADVMNVIHNRSEDHRWKELSHAGIALQRWQFSCWEPTSGADVNKNHIADNFEALMEQARRLLAGETPDPRLASCVAVADSFIRGLHPDLVKGATHYYATWIAPPKWAAPPAELTIERFGHRFYRKVA